MSAAFGTLVERLVGCQVYFAPDGALIGAASAAISALVKPATPATAYVDYSLGRVTQLKYEPKTKETTREWGSAYGGYKERSDKKIVTDAFTFTCIDYAPQLVDQLIFGTAALAAAGAQQAFQSATRFKDGWFYAKRINEAGVSITLLEIHARLILDEVPEDKNDPGSPKFRITHLQDAGALDTVTFAVG